jgi:glycerol-3-phosphate dehydrogenase
MTRSESFRDGRFDVVIIGGGMAGAGVARDLALRGLSVALAEKADFAYGTTSRSSKLIHGGLRYLELGDLGLVRESLRERETLARLAPQLIRPLPFLVPIYGDSSRSLIAVRIGLKLYHFLTPGAKRERYRVLRPIDALSLEQAIRADGLRGVGYYFDDLLVSPERLCLENVLSACRHGARAFNYAEVESVLRDARGAVGGVRVRDLLTDRLVDLRAPIVVNAAGPWVDRVRELARIEERGKRLVRTTKGIHCLLPRITERGVYHATSDGRMIFVIPWRDFSLVGTTDTDFDGDLDRVYATREEVAYLLQEVRRALPDPRVAIEHVAYTYAGVRPLTWAEGKHASRVSRQHTVVSEAGGRFLSISGTKLTCFRSLAAEVGDRVVRLLKRGKAPRTDRVMLDGTDEEVGRVEARTWLDVSAEMGATGLDRDTLETLVSTYGRAYPRVLEVAGKVPGGTERLCPENREIVAQLHVAVQDELAVSLQDVLLRRTGSMGELLGWTPRRVAAEIDAYRAHVARSHRFKAVQGGA